MVVHSMAGRLAWILTEMLQDQTEAGALLRPYDCDLAIYPASTSTNDAQT